VVSQRGLRLFSFVFVKVTHRHKDPINKMQR
jgi:hypothetical protein